MRWIGGLSFGMAMLVSSAQVPQGPEVVMEGQVRQSLTDPTGNLYVVMQVGNSFLVRRINRAGTIAWQNGFGTSLPAISRVFDGSVIAHYVNGNDDRFRRLNSNTGVQLSDWGLTGRTFRGFTGRGEPMFVQGNQFTVRRAADGTLRLSDGLSGFDLRKVEAVGDRIGVLYSRTRFFDQLGQRDHESEWFLVVLSATTLLDIDIVSLARYAETESPIGNPAFWLGSASADFDLLPDGRVATRGSVFRQVPGPQYVAEETFRVYSPAMAPLHSWNKQLTASSPGLGLNLRHFVAGNSVYAWHRSTTHNFRVVTPASGISAEFQVPLTHDMSALGDFGDGGTLLVETITGQDNRWLTYLANGNPDRNVTNLTPLATIFIPTPRDGAYYRDGGLLFGEYSVRRLRRNGTTNPGTTLVGPTGATLLSSDLLGTVDTDLWTVRTYNLSTGALSSRFQRLVTAPIGRADYYSTPAGVPLNVTVPSVLANDQDGDGDPLVSLLVSQPNPAQGTVSGFTTNGRFRFTPAPGFTGNADFYYRLRDTFNRYSGPILVRVTVR